MYGCLTDVMSVKVDVAKYEFRRIIDVLFIVKIPERISVIGFDDIPLSGKVTPALTTIRQQYLEFGRMAAESVVKMMKGDKEYHKYIVDVSLIERETV